jgi:hypothetical protein
MAKYRKKPVVIEAVQITEITWSGINTSDNETPWLREAVEKERGTAGAAWLEQDGLGGTIVLAIGTLEGNHRAQVGDWIIRGVAGEIYPCKPDIFAATYELVKGAQS